MTAPPRHAPSARADVTAWDFFTGDQRAELDEQLQGILPDDGTRISALMAIDMACALAAFERREGPLLEAQRTSEADGFDAIAAQVAGLIALLDERWPRWGMAAVDRARLRSDLETLQTSARASGRSSLAPRRNGRPPLRWRDRLIAVVFSVFPVGTAQKAAGSLFETTVERLLEMLEADVEDVHGVIVDALRRCPEPPYRVKFLGKG